MPLYPVTFNSNKEKEIFLSNKGYISGLRCEITNVAAKCKIIFNCSRNFIDIYK